MMTARQIALKALSGYRRDNAWPDDTFNDILSKNEISERDTALAARIIKGVMQNMMLIDYYIGTFSTISLNKLQPLILDILRLSVFQIVFLTKIPHNAAVNEGVALAKKHSNQKAAGYVNAVLRKISAAANSFDLPTVLSDSEIKRLSLQYSHPLWLVNTLFDILGENTQVFLESNNNTDTPVTIQTNILKIESKKLLAQLISEGAAVREHTLLTDCLLLDTPGRITDYSAYKDGGFYVQDAAARLAVIAAAPKAGDIIIDACAAPGGKTFASALAMKGMGKIFAFDVSEDKLKRVIDGAKRLDLRIIEPRIADATIRDDKFFETADIVFADVPCSGFGIIRKKPEIRYKEPDEISGLPKIQKQILANVSAYVKPGGTLLYSTCTVIKQENEDVVFAFLAEHPDYSLEAFSLPGIGEIKDGYITLWPHTHETDGFFIAKLRKP